VVVLTDEECVGYARECVRLAELTTDSNIRDQLLKMAREWMATAMHEAPTGSKDRSPVPTN
jgi:NADH:ubiquinone oxidoreductase subunit D